MSFASKRRAYALAAFLIGCSVVAVYPQAAASLQLQRTISLAGVEGRIDHFGFDPVHQRLFVCALGNNTVEVIDLKKGERIHTITGLGAPQGVACVPEFNRLFVANDKGGTVEIYDAESFQSLSELNLKDDADNIRYDDAAKKVYVGFGSGGIAVMNAADGKQVSSIKLAAHPEAFVLERHGKRIFVNVPNARHVAVIDRDRGETVATWGTDLTFGNFPVALDETNHRLFVGCRIPSKLVVLDTQSGKVITKINISGDPDDLYYDGKRHCIYAVCGAGRIDIIEQTDANSYKVSSGVATADGARTGLFVPELDTLFIGVPHHRSQQAEIRCFQVR